MKNFEVKLMKTCNWGILGLGTIAQEFAAAMNRLHPVYAVASRDREKAERFRQKYGATVSYGSYEELLSDPAVDIVYIATVNSQHYRNIMDCLHHGKHVLCEKAIWGNYRELEEAYALAREQGLILAEAMTIFHMPLYQEIKKLIRQGVLGKIKLVEADFGSLKEDDPNNRFFSPQLGGGAMLDIGTYGLSFVTFFLSGEITRMENLMCPYPTGVDEMWNIGMKTSTGEMGSVTMTFRAKLPKRGIIAGDKGYLSVMNYVRPQEATLVFPDGTTQTIQAGETARAMEYEILDLEKALSSGDYTSAYMEETRQVVRLMDQLLTSPGK